MDEKGYATLDDIRGRAVPNVTDWKYLNLKYDIKARIEDRCIQCGLCHIACEDTSHQAITATKDGVRHFEVVDSECVGCNLCMHVCPVEQCITMERVDSGDYANWTTHPNNPASADAGRVQARRHPRSTRRRLLDGVRRGRSSCIVAFRSTGPASVDAGADVLVECVR